MYRRFAILLAVLGTGCTTTSGRSLDPSRVVVAPSAWPTPQTLPPDARPRIIAVWMNETALRPGRQWMGKIITSTNVASVELRTESFSFTADRRRFGVFEFSQDILDVIPQYRRRYVLHLIGRNTRGEADERLIPIIVR
jgi:hypothetical protein